MIPSCSGGSGYFNLTRVCIRNNTMLKIDPQGIEVQQLFAAAGFERKQIVEIGCGDGRLTFRYADRAENVAGIEPDPEPLRLAARACSPELRGRLIFIQASATRMPLADATFDIALLAKSL